MLTRTKYLSRRQLAGFVLGEVLVSFGVLMIVFSGLIYGYVQANRMAEWSSMSLAAQSYASQGVEQVRAASWSVWNYPATYGPNGSDQLGPINSTNSYTTNFVDVLDVPSTGSPTNSNLSFWVTNNIYVTQYGSGNPPYRQIRCDSIWKFPLTGQVQTNTAIIIRTSDQ